jgi:hypothetical protein
VAKVEVPKVEVARVAAPAVPEEEIAAVAIAVPVPRIEAANVAENDAKAAVLVSAADVPLTDRSISSSKSLSPTVCIWITRLTSS